MFNPRATQPVNWPKDDILFATVTSKGRFHVPCQLLFLSIFLGVLGELPPGKLPPGELPPGRLPPR